MIRIIIDIDVKNHAEIIREYKGAMMSNLSSLFGGSKIRVEEEIKRQVRIGLQKNIKKSLEANGVKAEVSIH